MGFFDLIQNATKNYFDKKKEQREFMERLQLEAKVEQMRIFEQEFKENALIVAKAKAKKDAANSSGLQKLRQTTRLRHLNSQGAAPGSLFERLKEHTQKNLARREENLKHTAKMREVAKKMREEKQSEIQTRNNSRGIKSINKSSWKM